MGNKASMRCWTLQAIKDHCLVTVRDCWEWRTRPGVTPSTEQAKRYVFVSHLGEHMLLRRVGWKLLHGKLPPADKKLVPAVCGNMRCQNPTHCKPLGEKEKTRLAVERGSFDTPERRQAIAEGRRAKGTPRLDMDKARAIRTDPRSGPAVADEYGIHRSLVVRIRANKAWVEFGP